MEQDIINTLDRNERMVRIEIQKIAPNGLGYGEGGITYEAGLARIDDTTRQAVEAALGSARLLVPVDRDKSGRMLDDDGCGDGRVVSRIFEGTVPKESSKNRAKVFGGGLTMAVATRIGLGRTGGANLRQAFTDSIGALRDRRIDFGAHTDTHAHGPNCGCGAIDKAPRILANAVRFKAEITNSIAALGLDTTGLATVFERYEQYQANIEPASYTGKDVMDEIANNGKVIKELDDDHKEMYVILNLVEGTTVNQSLIRELSRDQAQAFAVDVWRLKAIADRLYSDQAEALRHQAFLSELVYTLATAATLTGGDLPVYVVNRQFEPVAA